MSVAEPVVKERDRAFTAFIEDFGPRWADAWNSHDPDRVLDLMTEDVVYDDSAWPSTMRGHSEVRQFLDYTWRAFPDLRFELVTGRSCTRTGPRRLTTGTVPARTAGWRIHRALLRLESGSSSKASTFTSIGTAASVGC
jgi:hypothetical protein